MISLDKIITRASQLKKLAEKDKKESEVNCTKEYLEFVDDPSVPPLI